MPYDDGSDRNILNQNLKIFDLRLSWEVSFESLLSLYIGESRKSKSIPVPEPAPAPAPASAPSSSPTPTPTPTITTTITLKPTSIQ